MDTSSSTNSNRIVASRQSKTLHLQVGCGKWDSGNSSRWQRCHSLRMPSHVHPNWDVVLNWHRQKRWRIDFEIGEGGRDGPCDVSLAALRLHFERNLLVLGRLAGELNLEIGINSRRCGSRFGQARAHGHQRKLGTARDLKHVKIAVAVSGIERLHWHRNQEVALTRVANRSEEHTSVLQSLRHLVCRL